MAIGKGKAPEGKKMSGHKGKQIGKKMSKGKKDMNPKGIQSKMFGGKK